MNFFRSIAAISLWLAVVIALIVGANEASARCPSHMPQSCGDGSCAPAGAVCCSGRKHCQKGYVCQPEQNRCIKAGYEKLHKGLDDTIKRLEALAEEMEAEAKRLESEAARQPQQAPPAGQRPTGGGNCGSDITGTGGPAQQRGSCPSRKVGLSCGTAGTQGDCARQHGYTPSKPYNHSSTPMRFQHFVGPEVIIKKGESLWSKPDGAGSGRVLVARRWNNEPTTNNCTAEYSGRAREEFQVNMECEMRRQEKLQNEFQSREDSYIDPADCRGSKEFADGWTTRSLEWWQRNPTAPVGYCVTPDVNDRRRSNRRPMREPNWSSAEKCKRVSEILGQTYELAVSPRGVRGCKLD